MSLFGDWVLTYQLLPSETCQTATALMPMNTTNQQNPTAPSRPNFAVLSAPVTGACPTNRLIPSQPSILRDHCGRIGQQCCPSTQMCDLGGTCYAGQCVASPQTCTGETATASSREFSFLIVDSSSGCATGDIVGVIANSLEEARGCLAGRGLTGLAPGEERHYTYRGQNSSSQCVSGSFTSSEADSQRCANALCGCSNAQVGGMSCFSSGQ